MVATPEQDLFTAALARELGNDDRLFVGANQIEVALAAHLARALWAPRLKFWASGMAHLDRSQDHLRVGRSTLDPVLLMGRDSTFWQARAFDDALRAPLVFAGGLQVDSRGNANLAGIRDSGCWQLRGPGSAGLPSLTGLAERFFIMIPSPRPADSGAGVLADLGRRRSRATRRAGAHARRAARCDHTDRAVRALRGRARADRDGRRRDRGGRPSEDRVRPSRSRPCSHPGAADRCGADYAHQPAQRERSQPEAWWSDDRRLTPLPDRRRPANGCPGWDDYPVHHLRCSAPSPPTGPAVGAVLLQCAATNREIAAILGAGVYPQRGVSEAYFCWIDGDQRQHNLRAVNALSTMDGEQAPGPLSLRRQLPLDDWSVAIAAGDLTVAGRFRGLADPYLYQPVDVPPAEPGGDYDQFRHFIAVGSWLSQPGPLHDTPGLIGARDRTWGVRTRRARWHNWCVFWWAAGCLR